jgi:hypothetical protein
MASFDFTSAMLDKGTTFIFGFWICVTNYQCLTGKPT